LVLRYANNDGGLWQCDASIYILGVGNQAEGRVGDVYAHQFGCGRDERSFSCKVYES